MKLYNSAYPGSMFQKPDGSYLEADDYDSIIAWLGLSMKERSKQIEDLQDANKQYEAANDALVSALEDLLGMVELNYAPENEKIGAAYSALKLAKGE